jgi:hypothetical protein
MHGTIRRLRAAAPLLALVLLFRLVVPSGYMIAPDKSGLPGLVLCVGAAAEAVERAHHGHDSDPAEPAPPESAEVPCPYAALAAPPLPPAPPAYAEPAPAPEAVPASESRRRIAQSRLAAPPPPSTGPPLPV